MAVTTAHGIVLVDKPSGPTSHDVVARLRRALGTRAVGHAGTLDPMASGLLVVGVGEGRKALRYLLLDDKRYLAGVQLGAETDTLDARGTVVERAEIPHDIDLSTIREVCLRFRGTIRQRPPRYSALKMQGRTLHSRARRGEWVEPPERDVAVHGIEVEGFDGREIRLSVCCGKGFYVRSFARDIARALGTVGHLSTLRRTRSGTFSAEGAVSFSQLEAAARGEATAAAAIVDAVRPLPAALSSVPCIALDASGVAHAQHGRPVPRAHAHDEPELAVGCEPVLLCDRDNVPVAFARVETDGYRVVRGLDVR